TSALAVPDASVRALRLRISGMGVRLQRTWAGALENRGSLPALVPQQERRRPFACEVRARRAQAGRCVLPGDDGALHGRDVRGRRAGRQVLGPPVPRHVAAHRGPGGSFRVRRPARQADRLPSEVREAVLLEPASVVAGGDRPLERLSVLVERPPAPRPDLRDLPALFPRPRGAGLGLRAARAGSPAAAAPAPPEDLPERSLPGVEDAPDGPTGRGSEDTSRRGAGGLKDRR